MLIPNVCNRVKDSLRTITPKETETTGSSVLRIDVLEEPISLRPIKNRIFDMTVEKTAVTNIASQPFGETFTLNLPVKKPVRRRDIVAAVVR